MKEHIAAPAEYIYASGSDRRPIMKDNPNVIEVELTLSQLEYLDGWGRRLNGMAPDTLIRMMIDSMMKTQPQLAEMPQKP